MKTVVVGSTNPIKITAAKLAFETTFPDESFAVQGFAAASGVSDQPMSAEETIKGAWTRVEGAKAAFPGADFWVAFEGGIEEIHGEMHSFAWATAQSNDGMRGKGCAGVFILPEAIARGIREGEELAHVTDRLFEKTNTKHNEGTIGILTHGIVDRTNLYVRAMVFALIPFINRELYPIT